MSDHAADEIVDGDIADVHGRDRLAVAHDGGAVRDLHRFFQTVRDINDSHTFGLQLCDGLEELCGFFIGQRRGWLVHDDDLGLMIQCLCDLDHLLLRNAETADPASDVDIHLQRIDNGLRVAVDVLPVDARGVFHRKRAEEDVFRNAQLRNKIELLIDDADAKLLRLSRRVDLDGLAVEDDLAGILLICAGQNFHKRGFPCAVFAQQRVDLAALNAEADVVERQNAREPL